MRYDEIDYLSEKAETRKDGVYSFKEFLWVVEDHKFVAFSDYSGNCYLRAGGFNVSIGKVDQYERRQKLKDWLRARAKK